MTFKQQQSEQHVLHQTVENDNNKINKILRFKKTIENRTKRFISKFFCHIIFEIWQPHRY